MNCRRTNILLSAYLDGELTGAEMLAVREHLDACSMCCSEHKSLLETKRLVSSLMYKAPRADLEALLITDQRRRASRGLLGTLADWSNLELTPGSVLRPRPLAATVLLSVAGFYLASTALNGPSEGFAEADRMPAAYPVLLNSGGAYINPVALTNTLPPPPQVGEVSRWVEIGPSGTSYVTMSQSQPVRPSSTGSVVILTNWTSVNTTVPVSPPAPEISSSGWFGGSAFTGLSTVPRKRGGLFVSVHR